jgi:hypothetical protein
MSGEGVAIIAAVRRCTWSGGRHKLCAIREQLKVARTFILCTPPKVKTDLPSFTVKNSGSEKMKAVVYKGPNEVNVEEVPDAKIERPIDVLVRITATNTASVKTHVPVPDHLDCSSTTRAINNFARGLS